MKKQLILKLYTFKKQKGEIFLSMQWNEADHPRDETGRFTFSGGSDKDNSNNDDTNYGKGNDGIFRLGAEITDILDNTKDNKTNNPKDVLYKNTAISKANEKEKTRYINSLLDILGNKATNTDKLYPNTKKLEQKIKDMGLGEKLKEIKASSLNTSNKAQQKRTENKVTGDFGFDKSPLNILHYDKLSNIYDKELGDFLRANTSNPEHYSNDLRHQYVSAIFARNLGQKAAEIFGNLNETRDIKSEPGDSNIDQINNEIVRNYAKLYPDMPRQELLKLMLKEHSKNQQIRIQKMKEKNKNNLDYEYM